MISQSLRLRCRIAFESARGQLCLERNDEGIWRGKLSASALSTATAIIAMREMDAIRCASFIAKGREWLAESQWASGGWGDTVRSLPNLSTTLLCWAALTGAEEEFPEVLRKCRTWIGLETGSLEPQSIVRALRKAYGKDQTFSVPILMALAVGGVWPPGEAWKWVPQLPFQLAAFPRRWFAALTLPVVSYALPALIAIGQVRHFHAPGGPGRWLRDRTQRCTLRLLENIQPQGGGFLEATPLTSFVTMALASMGLAEHPVAQRGLDFLERSFREEGSWPIDTDLATWATTLAVKALGETCPEPAKVHAWLLAQQHRTVHPYTLSAPGGWAWTDLPGGVPDADDTAGALLALAQLEDRGEASGAGVRWLLGLQNQDGGMPTFCRGWGTLPFDRSTPEITAHAVAAWGQWAHLDERIHTARCRAIDYLMHSQAADGSWTPLWFGNQWHLAQENPVYGTSSVVRDLAGLVEMPALARAVTFLLHQQTATGGWGAPEHESIEETALVLTSLARYSQARPSERERVSPALERGFSRLLELTSEGTAFFAAPIGLYFARLWYYEELYPLIWTTGALRLALELL